MNHYKSNNIRAHVQHLSALIAISGLIINCFVPILNCSFSCFLFTTHRTLTFTVLNIFVSWPQWQVQHVSFSGFCKNISLLVRYHSVSVPTNQFYDIFTLPQERLLHNLIKEKVFSSSHFQSLFILNCQFQPQQLFRLQGSKSIGLNLQILLEFGFSSWISVDFSSKLDWMVAAYQSKTSSSDFVSESLKWLVESTTHYYGTHYLVSCLYSQKLSKKHVYLLFAFCKFNSSRIDACSLTGSRDEMPCDVTNRKRWQQRRPVLSLGFLYSLGPISGHQYPLGSQSPTCGQLSKLT